MQESTSRFRIAPLTQFVAQLFRGAGLDEGKARVVADILIEADQTGHSTHGLALAPFYLEAATSGAMKGTGEPEVVNDRGACITWRGNRLPGPWLTARAVDVALDRVGTYGVVTVAISDSHHIGALSAYLSRATQRDCMVLIASSMPSLAGVAPFGGTLPVFTPNPMAAGIPTDGDPILLDVSASITTLNRTKQLARAGQRFPQPWVLDMNGNASDDPDVVLNQGGTLLPAGGLDHGHKGYSWAILAEALSQGVSGFGRADRPVGTCVSVFVQVIDPDAFGGGMNFKRQMTWLGDACRASSPRADVDRVRVPGERAAEHKRESQEQGVMLASSIVAGLSAWAEKLSLEMPEPLATDPARHAP